MRGRYPISALRWLAIATCVVASTVGCGHGSHYQRALTDLGLSVESRLSQRISLATDLITDAQAEFEKASGSLSIAEAAEMSGRATAIDLADDAYFRCMSSTMELERIIASIEDVGDPWAQKFTHNTRSLQESYAAMKGLLRHAHATMRSWTQAYERRLIVAKASPEDATTNDAILSATQVTDVLEEAASRAESFRRQLLDTTQTSTDS